MASRITRADVAVLVTRPVKIRSTRLDVQVLEAINSQKIRVTRVDLQVLVTRGGGNNMLRLTGVGT